MNHATKFVPMLILVACGTVTEPSVPLLSMTREEYTSDGAILNPCNGELVLTTVHTIKSTAGGNKSLTVKYVIDFVGTGQQSGAAYTGSIINNYTVSPGAVRQRETVKLTTDVSGLSFTLSVKFTKDQTTFESEVCE